MSAGVGWGRGGGGRGSLPAWGQAIVVGGGAPPSPTPWCTLEDKGEPVFFSIDLTKIGKKSKLLFAPCFRIFYLTFCLVCLVTVRVEL